MGGSKSSSSSKPKDMTPGAFKDLQGPFADVLNTMIGQYVPQGTQKIMQGYQGPTSAPISQGESQALQNLQGMGVNAGQPGGTNAPGQNPQNLYTGPIGPSQASQDLMNSTALTGTAQGANQFVQGLNIGGQPQQSLGDFRGEIGGASQTGAFGGNANNPFLQSAIEAAQRPTMQALEETLSRTLPGRFTQAGHIIQPGGSSAFDRAAAIASRGAADAAGDIATRMSYNAFEAAAGREATALENELARRGQMGLNTQNLTAQATQNQLDRALQIPGMEAQIQNTNAQTANTNANTVGQQASTNLTNAQATGQEVDTAIKNLQAQALPRLIQEQGLDRGIEAFNNNVNSLLATLGIVSGVTRPVVANESKSSSGSVQLK